MRFLFLTILLSISTCALPQKIEVVNFSDLEERLTTNTDSTFVVNFWATWCKPCVEELPAFFKVEDEQQDKKFKLLLVSLDFTSHIESRVKPFINKKNISTEIIILDDPDANTWINKVNANWDGSIPVTLIFNKNKSLFIDKTISYEDLKILVEDFEMN